MSSLHDAEQELVFLFDVDNTLLDNDGLLADFSAYLERLLGAQRAARYWAIHDELRQRSGYADYFGTLQCFRVERMEDPRVLQIADFLLDYPFATRLYRDALAVLARCGRAAQTIIVSDGDAVFQPHKIRRAGLAAAVAQRVLIYVHKEAMWSDIQQKFPARHYIVVDDKPTILAALKSALGTRITTVLPRQGHYALDPHEVLPRADLTIDRIGDLLDYEAASLRAAAATA